MSQGGPPLKRMMKSKSIICEHNKHRSACKECKGTKICQHNRIRSVCKDCGGASICVHGAVRSGCKACGGSQICHHNKRRYDCKACGGAGICVHNKRRYSCKQCKAYKLLETKVEEEASHTLFSPVSPDLVMHEAMAQNLSLSLAGNLDASSHLSPAMASFVVPAMLSAFAPAMAPTPSSASSIKTPEVCLNGGLGLAPAIGLISAYDPARTAHISSATSTASLAAPYDPTLTQGLGSNQSVLTAGGDSIDVHYTPLLPFDTDLGYPSIISTLGMTILQLPPCIRD